VYFSDNPVLTPANTLVIFQVCVAVDTVFDLCALNARQKLALLHQGINTIPKLQLLGTKQDDLFNKLKPSTLLPLNRGGCEFTIDAVTNLTALVLFYKDHKQCGQTPNLNAFGQAELNEYVKRITEGDEKSDEEDDSITGTGKFNLLSGMRHLSWNCSRRKGWQVFPSTMSFEKHCHLDMCLLMMKSSVSIKSDRWEWSAGKIRSMWHKSFSVMSSPLMPMNGFDTFHPSDGRLIHQTLVARYEGEF
jgi:hypothetical protein